MGDVEIICFYGFRWDRIFGYFVGIILVIFVVLVNFMLMNRCFVYELEINIIVIDGKYIVFVVLYVIVYIDNDIVILISFNCGFRELVC